MISSRAPSVIEMARMLIIGLLVMLLLGSSHAEMPSIVGCLMKEPKYVELIRSKSGVHMAGEQVEMASETLNSTIFNETTINTEPKNDADAFVYHIFQLFRIQFRQSKALLWSFLENVTPQSVFKMLHDSKASVLATMVIASMTGFIGMFLYWILKMPQICIASFQVHLQIFPWWVYWPCMSIFITLCLLYTLAQGELYRFYFGLYESKQLSMVQAISLGIAQLLVRVLCSFAVASIATLPPIWALAWVHDFFFPQPKGSTPRSLQIRQKLKNYEFGPYLNWTLIASLLSYAVLAILVSNGTLSRSMLYDLRLLSHAK